MEDDLHGIAGYRKVIVNARGVEQGEDERERREPVRGSGLVLTIDHELQRTAMQNFGEQSGSAGAHMAAGCPMVALPLAGPQGQTGSEAKGICWKACAAPPMPPDRLPAAPTARKRPALRWRSSSG